MNIYQGRVLIISASDSFLAKSLGPKIESHGITVYPSKGDIKEIADLRDYIDLTILFLDDEILEMSETLIYLNDMARDLDRRIVVIGDREEYAKVQKVIPQTLVLKFFERPLVMDDLIKCVTDYIEKNTGENRKKTILIVDDDITYMRTVYEWLKDDYHVGMAQNGVQAISYLARNKANLVLLDYEMPVADGPKVLEMLRADTETGHIPVMFLTGHGDRNSVMSVVGLKPADYLLKTIDKKTLLEKLDHFFRG